jgi:acetyl esterase/lipase
MKTANSHASTASSSPLADKARRFGADEVIRRSLTTLTRGSSAALFVSIFVAWTASAAEPLVVEVWPGKVPEESGGIGPERIRMSPKLDRKQVEVTEQTRLITAVTNPTLTVYRPPKDKETGTAMLICPGGGYWDLYWQLEGEEVATWLNSIGVTGIILKYRVPRRPDEPKGEPARRPLQDAQRAMSLVRSKASQWGIHPERIGIVGFSAGGHLAIATATSFDKRTYEPIDDVDKISCRPDFAIPVYSGYLKAKEKDEVAPGLKIPAGTPPIFLVHGGEDIISPPEHSVLMYLALKRAGVPTELHVYANTAHDFGVRTNDHPYSTWTARCADWLRDNGLLPTDAKK